MKKILIIILGLLSFLNQLSAQDSLRRKQLPREYFIDDISDQLNVSLFALTNKSDINVIGKAGANLTYTPNDYTAIGVSVRLNWLGLAFSYAPKNIQEKEKGTTTYTNIKLSSYGKKMGFDIYYLDYSGYYLNNTKDVLPNTPPKTFYIRNDLSTLNIGANYYYIFNHKRYSYRSTFIQNEIQKHSAGSFMLSTSLNYYNIRADSSIVPRNVNPDKFGAESKLQKGDFYNLCFMPGYGHTFVAYKRFFLTLSAFGGIDFQQQHYTSELINGNKVFDEFEIIPRAMGRAGIGYNYRRFFTGLTGVADVYNLPLGKNERISYSVGSVSFYFGYHFSLPKSIKRYTDYMKKFPNLNFQKSKH
ncbi:MAG: DUF4421 family protein [Bacteroidota bacterium]